MSDQWQFFPCSMANEQAFIFLDTGIQDAIDNQAPPLLVVIDLTYKDPYPNGLPQNTEFDAISSIEENLEQFAEKSTDWYVGRVTVSGHRYFYIYTSSSESLWIEFIDFLSSQTGYDLAVSFRNDPEHRGYWDELYPGPDDLQIIKDLKVIEILDKNGDNGAIPRKVDHWMYFPSKDISEAFQAWLADSRFVYEQAPFSLENGKFCVRVSHYGSVKLSDISSYTIELNQKVAEFGGEYDGWETELIKIKSVG